MSDDNSQPGSSDSSRKGAGGDKPADLWRQITDGLKLQDLWTRFKEETREGYRVSSREVDTLVGETRQLDDITCLVLRRFPVAL